MMRTSTKCQYLLLSLLAVLVLGGCQRTQFTSAPADSNGCSRELVGQWLSNATNDNAEGEIEAMVDADCQLQVTENGRQPRVSVPTQLRTAQVANVNLLWIDTAWADKAFELETDAVTPPAGSDSHDVYVFAWSRTGDQLVLLSPDHKALAHALIDGKLKGGVLQTEYDLHVRLKTSQTELQSLIAKGGVFDSESTLVFTLAKRASP